MVEIIDYDGPIDPKPLVPKTGKSYLHIEELVEIVDLFNDWQWKSSLKNLDQLINTTRDEDLKFTAKRLLAESYLNLNKYKKAYDSYNEILDIDPKDKHALTVNSVLALQLGLNEESKGYLARLRRADLVYYTKIKSLLDFIRGNKDRQDFELGFSTDVDIDTLALFGNRCDGGKLSDILLTRIKKLLKMSKIYPEARIIVTGGAALSPDLEADLMEEWLVKKGVDPRRIYKDPYAKDTVGNVMGITKIMEDIGTKKCLAITSLSHLARAWMSLYVHEKIENNTALIYAAAPEEPNSIVLPETEKEYMLITILRSAKLYEWKDFK